MKLSRETSLMCCHVPGPLTFQCTTLKRWEWPRDEAIQHQEAVPLSQVGLGYLTVGGYCLPRGSGLTLPSPL